MPSVSHMRSRSYYKYNILLERDGLASNWTRDRIVDDLNARGVPARVGACPDISRESAFANSGINTTNTRPNADDLTDRTIMLPVHPTLTEGNVAFMAEGLRDVLSQASR
jgi:dTDP-4-amino-4,6-dideoxygalactose transaminase